MNKAAQALGRLGGKAGKGAAKARTSEQARAAVQVRWKKHRKTKGGPAKPNDPSSATGPANATK
jgi:hypothetical protein